MFQSPAATLPKGQPLFQFPASPLPRGLLMFRFPVPPILKEQLEVSSLPVEPMRFTDVPELSDAAELYKDKSSARSASRRSPEGGAKAAATNGGNSFDFVNGNNRHSKRGYTSPSGTVPWCQSATDNNGNNGNNGNHGPLATTFRVPPEDPSRALQTNSPVGPSRARLTKMATFEFRQRTPQGLCRRTHQ